MFVADSSITRDGFYRICTKCGHYVGLSTDSLGFYMLYTLTPCCGAACKLTGDSMDTRANVCKACYRRMPDDFGEGDLVSQLRVAGCDTPEECAEHVLDIARVLIDRFAR